MRGKLRNHKTAGEKQELAHLRYRVKELEEKNDRYDARATRRFHDAEPLEEENESLRTSISGLKREVARLNAVVNPGSALFFSGREVDGKLIGGRQCNDDWAMLSMGLSVLMVSSGNVKPVVEAIA